MKSTPDPPSNLLSSIFIAVHSTYIQLLLNQGIKHIPVHIVFSLSVYFDFTINLFFYN